MDPASPDLELVIGGRPARFPAVWLRDNCPCPDCLAPGTGQKLNDITDIPNGLAITRTEDAGESVLVTFAPDQHQSAFPRSWLEEHALDGERDGDGRTEDDKELWLPADLDGLPAMSWPSYLAGGKATALEAMLRLGFFLLSGVPAEPGRVLEVAAADPARTAAQPAAGTRGLPGLRQHPGAARPHRLQPGRGLAGAAPAGLLRRPGRPGQHAGRTKAGGEPVTAIEAIAELLEQAAAFRALPYARDAVAVRRWDDEAKDPSAAPPEFGHFEALLRALLQRDSLSS